MAIKEAILLAAGFGTRLRPLTDTIPKCLVEINGKPLLQIWIEQLVEVGVESFHINTHYLSHEVEEFVEQCQFKNQISLYYEPDLLGTAGSLRNMIGYVNGESILVAHADNYCECDWEAFKNTHELRKFSNDLTMMLFKANDPTQCGIVELDTNNRVIAFHEKVEQPPSNLANAAIYLMPMEHIKSILQTLNGNTPDISLDLIPKLIGNIQTWENNGYLCDIGNLKSLSQTRSRF